MPRRKRTTMESENDEDYQTSQQRANAREERKRKAARSRTRRGSGDIPSTSANPPLFSNSPNQPEGEEPARSRTRRRNRNIPSTSTNPPPTRSRTRRRNRDIPSTSANPPLFSSNSDESENEQSLRSRSERRNRNVTSTSTNPPFLLRNSNESEGEEQARQPTTLQPIAVPGSTNNHSDDDDSDYETARERDRRLNTTRRRILRERRIREMIDSDESDEEDDISVPVVMIGSNVCRLGDANYKPDIWCKFCGAVDFRTIPPKNRRRRRGLNTNTESEEEDDVFGDPKDHNCCDHGKVFIPPMRKLPEEVLEVMDNWRTKKDIVSYNTCFSFASLQYHKVPAAPFGLQVAKTLGPVRHFPSAALPANPNNPRFGNYYLYMGDQAVNLRMEGFSHLDREVVEKLESAIERCHPFAHTLKTMGEVMKEVQRSGELEDLVRLRIVDARDVKPEFLRGNHPKLYREPIQCGEHVALFYSCTVEQDIALPGLTIYPRRNDSIPMPLFPNDPRINCFCYPLLFLNGEVGWKWKGFELAEDPTTPYVERLKNFAERYPARAADWELPYTPEELLQHQLHYTETNDPNIQEPAVESDDEEDDDEADELLHDLESYVATGEEHEQGRVQERGGQDYPTYHVSETSPNPHTERDQDSDEDMPEEPNPDLSALLHEDQPSTSTGFRVDLSGDIEDYDIPIEDIEANFMNAMDNEEYPIRENDYPHVPNVEDLSDSDLEERNPMIDDEAIEAPPESTENLRNQITGMQRQHRKYVSLRQWGLYVHQERKVFQSDRECVRNRFASAGKLGQVFLLDLCTRMYQMRHGFQREHHTEFMSSTRKKFLDAIQRSATRYNRTIGCVSSVPASVPGSPRHLQRCFEHTVAMSRARRGNPDCFITITCNTNWPEIQNNLLPGETWVDRPMMVCKVFKKKADKMLMMILGQKYEQNSVARRKGLFGFVRWFAYSVEFQQRGPPHVHLVFSLKKHLNTAAKIDKVCQAVLPPLDGTDETAELRELVESFMIHRPCRDDDEAYCRHGLHPDKEKCRKNFPHEFSDNTKFGDRSYPELRRPDDGEFCLIGNKRADNRYVVSYNKQLLTYFRAHINVEVVSNLSVVKYIFKYIFKGYDRVLVEAITSLSAPETSQMTIEGHLIYPKSLKIPPGAKKRRELEARRMLAKNGVRETDDQNNPVLVYDEYTMIEDARAITACEAAWEFLAYPRHEMSHTVVDLFVHGPQQEPLIYEREEQAAVEQQLLEQPEVITRFKEWFALNQRDEEARNLTYEELPTRYVFRNHQWRKRKNHRELLFGRIKSVHPRNREVFAIRLLCTVQKGCRSFEELRTVDGVLHPNFVSAAKALGLMNAQDEWDRCLQEASAERVPVTLRRMFAAILVFNFVRNPPELWEKHKEAFYERRPNWTDEQKEAHALYHIDSFLRAHLTCLKDFDLPDINTTSLPARRDLVDDSGMNEITQEEAARELRNYTENMNAEQETVFNRIMQSVGNPEHTKPFFIQGSGGTGKTRVMKALCYALTANGHKVACVAHTGNAATLLPFGSTAHRRFHIPLATEENMRCTVDLESDEAARLSHIDVVIWDEATMTDRRILNAIHLLMVDLHPENEALPFAGVKLVFGGDWKQTLPIVPEARGPAVVNYTMKGSDLWRQDKIEVLYLTENMRARYDQPFSNWIADVGLGRINLNQDKRPEDQLIELSFGQLVDSEGELLDKVFGDLSAPPQTLERVFASSAVLAVDNNTTFDVNERALNRMEGDARSFLSIDEHLPERKFHYMDPEAYHPQTPPGMPPHHLLLKKGAPIILLMNINTTLGLVNGTRMVVDEIGENIVWARPLHPTKRTPARWPLTRMHFSPINVLRRERCFQRTQFPIRLAFAITCNRAQGQTLDKVGLLLRTPCFSHGQFYVAVSRVRRSNDLFIYNAQAAKLLEQQEKWKDDVLKKEKEERQKEAKKHKKEREKEMHRIRNEKYAEKRRAQRQQAENPQQSVIEDVDMNVATTSETSVPYTPFYYKDPIWFGPEDNRRRFLTNNVVYRNAL